MLDELKELEEANAKAEADKLREKDLEQGKHLQRRQHGCRGSRVRRIFEKNRDLNLRRQACAKVDEHGKPKPKNLRNGSRQK